MKYPIPFLLSLIVSSYAVCCTCVKSADIKENIASSGFILYGKVVSIKQVYIVDSVIGIYRRSIRAIAVTLEVKKCYKGSFNKDTTVTVYTHTDQDECGYTFKKRRKYIVYGSFLTQFPTALNTIPAFLYTNRCYRTGVFSRQEEKSIIENL